jgi:hypothetical protein
MHGSEHSMGSGVVDPVRHHRWRLAVVGAFALSLTLGTLGYHDYLKSVGEDSWRNSIYHTAQLFGLHAPHFAHDIPWKLEVARWLAPLTTLLALVGFGVRLLREEVRWWKLWRWRRHVIVCGLGCKGMALVRRLRGAGQAVVVIEKDLRPELAAACAQLGAVVVAGDATRRETLAEAGVAHAARLFAVCPEDAVNCEIAAQVSELLAAQAARPAPLECLVHLSDAELREGLQQSLRGSAGFPRLDLRLGDAFDPEARRLLVEGLPLDHDGLGPEDPRCVRLVILGFGRLGRALAVRAAQLGCFANGQRLRVAVIDRAAERHREALLFRHPQIGQVADLEFHQQEAASPRTREQLATWCAEAQTVTSVAVCFDNEPLALELSLQLAPLLAASGARLAARLGQERGLAHLLQAAGTTVAGAADIRVFGLEEQWCAHLLQDGVASDAFARRIHAEYERLTGTAPADVASVNEAGRRQEELRRWLAQPEDFRESCRQQAAHIYLKLRAIGCEVARQQDARPAVTEFLPAQVEMLARWEHARWVAERTVAAWRYAPGPKDTVHRTNPNLVDWAKLDARTQDYDRRFVQLIPQLLTRVELKVCRREPLPA